MKRLITSLFIFAIAVGVLTPVSFSLVPETGFVHTTQVHASTDTAADLTFGNIGSCGVLFGELGNCLAYFFYFLPYWVGGLFLNMGAWFLDITASLTLSSDMITNSAFIQTGWALMRDIANVFFILILLYIAICIVLEIHPKGGGDPKKMIWYTILMAILINFSMFVTSIVIDTSNTLALVFYNQINVTTVGGAPVAASTDVTAAENNITGGGSIKVVEPKQISVSLASAFHPQAFSNPDFWEGLKTDNHWYTSPSVPPGTMIAILLMMGLLFIMVTYSFLIAGFSFLGRMVELFILIIFSPIAFVSFIVPGLKEMDYFGWTKWWSRLIDVSFAAPLYFMMLYLISIILNQGLFGGQNHAQQALTTNSWPVTMVGDVLIPAIFLFIMLSYATKFVMKASGTIGSAIGGAAKVALVAAGGFALGSAAGGIASVGRNSLGRLGERFADNKWVQQNKTKAGFSVSGWASRAVLSTGKGMQTASYDVRQTKAGAGFTKLTGMSLGSVGGLSMKAAAGGYANKAVRAQATNEKRMALIGYDKKAEKDITHQKEHQATKLDALKIQIDIKKDQSEAADKEKTAAKNKKDIAEKNLKDAKTAYATNPNAATLDMLKTATLETNNKTAEYQGGQIKDALGNIVKTISKQESASGRAIPPKIELENMKAEARQIETGKVPERATSDIYDPVTRQLQAKEGDILHYGADGNPKFDGSGSIRYGEPLRTHDPVTNERMVHPQRAHLALTDPARFVTKDEAMKAAGTKDLENMLKQNKTAQGKEFLLNKASTKYNIPDDGHHIKRNAAGDVTGFHFDPKNELRTTSNKFMQSLQTMGTAGVALGTVAGIASTVLTGGNPVIGYAVGSMVAGAVGAREFRKGAGTTVRDAGATGVILAEHAAGGDHAAHPTEVKTNAPQSFGQVMSATGKALTGGGGGGGGGGHAAPKGGGGHGGGHDGGHGGGHGGH